ncbi:MAG: hypothetical protein HC814_08415 [Rhodobacteraceae bacterium]|nr:hypothetical protein [Paracoccaceae bacterium]
MDIAVGAIFGIASIRANRYALLEQAEFDRMKREDAAAKFMRESQGSRSLEGK